LRRRSAASEPRVSTRPREAARRPFETCRCRTTCSGPRARDLRHRPRLPASMLVSERPSPHRFSMARARRRSRTRSVFDVSRHTFWLATPASAESRGPRSCGSVHLQVGGRRATCARSPDRHAPRARSASRSISVHRHRHRLTHDHEHERRRAPASRASRGNQRCYPLPLPLDPLRGRGRGSARSRSRPQGGGHDGSRRLVQHSYSRSRRPVRLHEQSSGMDEQVPRQNTSQSLHRCSNGPYWLQFSGSSRR
jgi:hypothetical protein